MSVSKTIELPNRPSGDFACGGLTQPPKPKEPAYRADDPIPETTDDPPPESTDDPPPESMDVPPPETIDVPPPETTDDPPSKTGFRKGAS